MNYRNQAGEYHREDGPAVEWADGHKEWWINGKRHREGGPAYERVDGYKSWYINNNRHRIGGPARVWGDGRKSWFINDHQLPADDIPKTKEEWLIAVLKYS